jgi:pyruvate/2-oxoglutarate/acetoin dehydrogenase E1 component
MENMKYSEAIGRGITQSMELDPNIFMTGLAVDYSSGIFGSTLEPMEKFPNRVFDSPAMENSLTGIAVGAAVMGKRPIIVHPRCDFMFLSFDMIINLAAKWKYMYGGNAGTVPIVVRAIIGKGWGQGASHSQSIQSLLGHFPGLYVLMPSFPADAKGLMISAMRSNSPVIILEHRSLYDISGPTPLEPIAIPFGTANKIRSGEDVTIVSTSLMSHEALRAADMLSENGIEVEIIDLRSIRPIDEGMILSSVTKTGRLVIADTSWESYGVTSEISALVAEKAFNSLKSPIRRISLANCPAPVSQPLEKAFYPTATTIAKVVLSMLDKKVGNIENIDLVDNFKGPY